MKIECIPTGFLNTNCYIITGSDYLMVIDPGDDFQKIQDNLPLSPTQIVLTHSHFDHVGALYALKEKYPQCPVFVHENEDYSEDAVLKTAGHSIAEHMKKRGFYLPESVLRLSDGDEINNFRVLLTPGHTMGSVCLYHAEEKVLFSGDTLFYHSYGRTDLGGDENCMYESLKKLMALDGEVTVYPGHGQSTTIAAERNYLGI